MSEDLTQNLPSRPFEERVLAELEAIRGTLSQLDTRLTSFEEKVDARLHDTRPMWEAVQARLTGVEKKLGSNNRHLKSFAGELGVLSNRVEHLENLRRGRPR